MIHRCSIKKKEKFALILALNHNPIEPYTMLIKMFILLIEIEWNLSPEID